MADSVLSVKIRNSTTIENETIIKLNKQTSFTSVQIENLLKLQLLNADPQTCVLSVSSILKLENIHENNINFWLADTMSVIVKNIQRARMTVLQGSVVVCWIIHFMSLVIEEKLSKKELFEKLRECVKTGLANAEEFLIPYPNNAECPKYNPMSSKSDQSIFNVTAMQMIGFIMDTLRETFWDDFKYTLIQIAFNSKPLKVKKMKYKIKDVEPPSRQRGNNDDEAVDNREENSKKFCAIIMDKYFFRKLNDASSVTEGLQQLFCGSLLGFETTNEILPLSAACLDEQFIENLKSSLPPPSKHRIASSKQI